MIHDVFLVLLWITAILLIISGIDDLYLDLLYWFLKGRYKSKFPDFSTMHYKKEKPIAVLLGAWNESSVIGRTLSYAVNNIRYKNYKIFVGVYPNDIKTIDAVKEIALKDPRVIPCINPQNGPTTKADNLNSLYAGLCDYEKIYGEFEILIIHDAEDFIHPSSMKLYNFLIGYKGYHGIQIPVIPIKSKEGTLFHRTYCDAFAEIHTKDLIVRSGMGTFLPFSGTGMGFHRKVMYYLEKSNIVKQNAKNGDSQANEGIYEDALGRKIELGNDYFKNNEEEVASIYENNTNYKDDPFKSLHASGIGYKKTTKTVVKEFTGIFSLLIFAGIGFLIYTGNTAGSDKIFKGLEVSKDLFVTNAYADNVKITDTTLQIPKLVNYENAKPGFYDKNFDVFYIPLDNGKIGIQESVWGSVESAEKRLKLILVQPTLNDLKGFIARSVKNDKYVYRVIIGNFDNIDDSRKYTTELRQYFQN
jgi:hypothetical protein